MGITENELIGSHWSLNFYDVDLNDTEIEFCADGKLVDIKSPNTLNKWSITDNNVNIDYNSGYVKYVGEIENDLISGTAKNKERVKWTFKAERIHKNSHLIGTRWLLKEDDYPECEIEFQDNGKLTDIDHPQYSYTWKQTNNSLLLNYNNGYVIYSASINNNTISGTARNKEGKSWTFKAERILKNTNLIGTHWLLKCIGVNINDKEIEFCANGKLVETNSPDTLNEWYITDNNVIINYNNNFVVYSGKIETNLISGTARNIKGTNWTFEAEKILKGKKVNFLIDTQQILERSSVRKSEESTLIKKTKEEFTYFYYYEYYPTRLSVSKELDNVRHIVWDFKNGGTSEKIATIFAEKVLDMILKSPISNWWLCVIPASTKEKTEIRFKKFCEKYCEITKINNGYSLIFTKSDRNAIHLQTDRSSVNILDSVDFVNVRGKNILLFDDIYTTGKSFIKISRKLKNLGANEVVGMFLGKTHWLEDDNNENNDLPY